MPALAPVVASVKHSAGAFGPAEPDSWMSVSRAGEEHVGAFWMHRHVTHVASAEEPARDPLVAARERVASVVTAIQTHTGGREDHATVVWHDRDGVRVMVDPLLERQPRLAAVRTAHHP